MKTIKKAVQSKRVEKLMELTGKLKGAEGTYNIISANFAENNLKGMKLKAVMLKAFKELETMEINGVSFTYADLKDFQIKSRFSDITYFTDYQARLLIGDFFKKNNWYKKETNAEILAKKIKKQGGTVTKKAKK